MKYMNRIFSYIFPFLVKQVTIETVHFPETDNTIPLIPFVPLDEYYEITVRDSRSRVYRCYLWPHEFEALQWKPRDTITIGLIFFCDPNDIRWWRCK